MADGLVRYAFWHAFRPRTSTAFEPVQLCVPYQYDLGLARAWNSTNGTPVLVRPYQYDSILVQPWMADQYDAWTSTDKDPVPVRGFGPAVVGAVPVRPGTGTGSIPLPEPVLVRSCAGTVRQSTCAVMRCPTSTLATDPSRFLFIYKQSLCLKKKSGSWLDSRAGKQSALLNTMCPVFFFLESLDPTAWIRGIVETWAVIIASKHHRISLLR